jgi:hypothetical protein
MLGYEEILILKVRMDTDRADSERGRYDTKKIAV